MILIIIAILSVIIGLIRRGSFANILETDLKASFLFVLSLLFFIAVKVGNAADIGIIIDFTYWILLAAYSFLLLGIILNLTNLWMFILLLGAVLNFVVIFINGGKMPVSLETLQMAGLSADYLSGSATQVLAGSATNLAFLGGIIPIPLPSIFAEVISPGTLIIGIGIFGMIQNILLGIVYVYEDEDEDEEIVEKPKKIDKKEAKEEKKKKKNKEQQDEDYFYDDDDDEDSLVSDDDEDFTFGKDYTMGNININDTDDDDDDVDESLFSKQIPQMDEEESFGEDQSTKEILDEILERDYETKDDSEELSDAASFFADMESENLSEPETDLNLNENLEFESEEMQEILAAEENLAASTAALEEYQDTMVIPTEELQYAQNDEEELPEMSYSTDALKEAREVIENDMPLQKEILDYNKEVAQDAPLQADTDSPFIIVNGRIVENPYYKFKKGERNNIPDSGSQMESGVYVMKSRNPSVAGRPSFSPPNRNVPERKVQATDEDKQGSGYEKVEMKIGDVQIKFWKKDKDE